MMSSASCVTMMSKCAPLSSSIPQHALVDPIQVVGFRGGPVVRADGEMHVAVEVFHFPNRCLRQSVIGISAGEIIDIGVPTGGEIVLEHPAESPDVRAKAARRRQSVSAGRRPAPHRPARPPGPSPASRWISQRAKQAASSARSSNPLRVTIRPSLFTNSVSSINWLGLSGGSRRLPSIVTCAPSSSSISPLSRPIDGQHLDRRTGIVEFKRADLGQIDLIASA